MALEALVAASLELPAFSTLDRLVERLRSEANRVIFDRVTAAMAAVERESLDRLLVVPPEVRKSAFQRLKDSAGRATWSALRSQLELIDWLDGIGPTERWLAGIADAKIADFAGEAAAGNAAVLGEVGTVKRRTLLASLVHVRRVQARDDLCEMFVKRVAGITKRARAELEATRARQQDLYERLVGHYRDLLGVLDPDVAGETDPATVLSEARAMIDGHGGFANELDDIEAVAASYSHNWTPLVAGQLRHDRSGLFAFARAVTLMPASTDRRLLDALSHALAHAHRHRDWIPADIDDVPVAVSFASDVWQRTIRHGAGPGRFSRRHSEAAVFVYLADALRTGDVTVEGSQAYGNWTAQVLSWEDCQAHLAGFCAEVGLADTAAGFVAGLHAQLAAQANKVDAGYPDNTDLVIDPATGVPSLKRRTALEPRPSALALEAAVKERLAERALLDVVARTGHWLGWWHRFGPASGSDPKLADAFARYMLVAFTYGTNLGPHQAARHLAGVTAQDLATIATRHVTIDKLNAAISDVINAHLRLDVTRAWGDASTVAADGTQIDTWIDNLLAESHVRYGGYGGIAYHHVADTYIALFSRFIPCGVWEAVYLLDGLLANTSDVQPDTIHADTHGQSYPVHALAHLLGFQLPRIRNWRDLIFYRPTPDAAYTHIDALFDSATIDWDLIASHWPDLMRIAISISNGTLSSVLLLRRLGVESRRNRIYQAFREVGRAIRTITLLRYISEPGLRVEITAATNKAESYNAFSEWLRFGSDVFARNDPDEQEKLIKFNTLLANCVIFHTTVDITAVLRELLAEGWDINPDDVATISPYLTIKIKRFGDYNTDQLTDHPTPSTRTSHSHPATPAKQPDAPPRHAEQDPHQPYCAFYTYRAHPLNDEAAPGGPYSVERDPGVVP